MVGTSRLIENNRSPISIADIDALDINMVNRFDRSTAMRFSDSSASASDVFRDAIWAAPFALALSKQGRENGLSIALMYAQVFSLNGGVTLFVKSAVGRFRPFAYNPEGPILEKLEDNTRRSFFSGHTSHVASLSFFTATVFSDLYPNSKFKALVWGAAIAAPAVTAYLRVSAGRHFPTDVIAGYGVGALIGHLIPRLNRLSNNSSIDIIGGSDSVGIIYTL